MSGPVQLDPKRRAQRRAGWVIVAIAAAAVAATFLIPSDDDAAAEQQAKQRATPVAVAPVEQATVTERRRYPGELDADAADVSSFYPGRVEAVRVRVGDVVKEGAVLVELDPVDAREQIARARAQAQAAVSEQQRAAVELEAAKTELKRFDAYRDQVSDSEYDAQQAKIDALRAAVTSAEARGAEARAGLRLLEKRVVESEIRAPFAGRIAARHVDPGVIVAAGTPLVRVVAVAPLRIRFDVPEQEIAGLAEGATVRVVTQAGADDRKVGTSATITGVGAEVDRERRVATIEAVVDQPPAGWLPGMYAEAIVDRRTVAGATVVPSNAVLSRLQPDGTIAVGVLVADGEVARWVPVTEVAREGDRIAIEPVGTTLAAGAQVLVAGHVDLSDGSRIQVAGAAEEGR